LLAHAHLDEHDPGFTEAAFSSWEAVKFRHPRICFSTEVTISMMSAVV